MKTQNLIRRAVGFALSLCLCLLLAVPAPLSLALAGYADAGKEETPAESPALPVPEEEMPPVLEPSPPKEAETLPPLEQEEPEHTEDTQQAEEEEQPSQEGPQPQEEYESVPQEVLADPALISAEFAAEGSSVIVTTYSELLQALGEDNGIDTVYLGADITAVSGGVEIHSSKTSITIDGCPPGAPDGTKYTLIQYASGSMNDLIRVTDAASLTKEITLRNLRVTGQNHFGIVAVAENVKGVTVTQERVEYTGPQAAYNRGGLTRFVDSSYILQASPGISVNELAETLHAEFEGAVDVRAEASGNAILWLTGAASTLRVLANSDVEITTNNYFLYTGGNEPAVVLEADARLAVVNRRGFVNTVQSVSTFLIEEGAKLHLEQNSPESYAALRVSKRFEMRPGSKAVIVRTGADGIPLRLTAAGGEAVFNRPDRVFFYSSAGVPLRFTGGGKLSITASAINLWGKTAWPQTGAAADHIWNRADASPLTLSAEYTGEDTVKSFTHNLKAEDPALTALEPANFSLRKNQLIAFGELYFVLDTPYSSAGAITGHADPDTEVSAVLPYESGAEGTLKGAAGPDGSYLLPIEGGALKAGELVTAVGTRDGLFMRQQSTVLAGAGGKLEFLSAPGLLEFQRLPVPGSPTVVARQEDLVVFVSDSRPRPGRWRLDVALEAPLATVVEGREQPLGGAVVFAKNGETPVPLGTDPLTIYRHEDGQTPGEIQIRWGRQEGLLLSLKPGCVYSDVEYRAAVVWTLTDAP